VSPTESCQSAVRTFFNRTDFSPAGVEVDRLTVDPRTASEPEIKSLARLDLPLAREVLFLRFGERLRYHAFGILHDAAEAGDVVQEVFIKAMREPRLFDADFRTQAWLYRVTRNLCFNLSRDRKRRGAILNTMPSRESVGEDPLDRLFDDEAHEGMMALVDQLTDDHRAILLLRYYEDLSYNEIAARLHIKMGTVMSRLSRARDRLEAMLAEGEDLREAS
jgi:RNA polymerase sigma-70 factor (ECF subfamily)